MPPNTALLAGLAVGLSACSSASAQPEGALPIDPRHHFDKRCPPAITLDPATHQRDPASTSSYLWTVFPNTASVSDCARACCGDWSCESFAFVQASKSPPAPPPAKGLSGDWINHDSLRGLSDITMTQASGGQLSATSLQPRNSRWTTAVGRVDASGTSGFLAFDSSHFNNRSFKVSADGQMMHLERLSMDPVGFTQNFSRATVPFGPGGNCTGDKPCCIFKDDIDKLVPGTGGTSTGVRAKLPAVPAPYPNSSLVKSAVLDPKIEIGINGDEFPITCEISTVWPYMYTYI